MQEKKPLLTPADFAAMRMADRARLLDDDLLRLNMGAFREQGVTRMARLFQGCAGLQRPDLSGLDAPGVTDMERMFENCGNLRSLDLSAFDFSRVKYMRAMFAGCEHLEEVLLSDTVCRAAVIPRHTYVPYTRDELNEISRWEYITSGPQLADMAVERAVSHGKQVTTYVSFESASKSEVYDYLGLSARAQLVIVPHTGV